MAQWAGKVSSMSNEPNENINLDATPEELEAEKEAMAEVGDDDLRSEIAERLGVDPDTEGELLDKLVEDKKADRKRFSKAVGQKIKYREAAQKFKPTESDEDGSDKDQKPGNTEKPEEDFDTRFERKMAERDLEAMDLPDELKEEVKKVAAVQGVSVREASKDPYIVSRIEAHKRAERADKASPGRNNKGGQSSDFDPSKQPQPSDYQLDTKEGQEAWKRDNQAYKKHKRENA